jgi:rhomboid protease GluP
MEKVDTTQIGGFASSHAAMPENRPLYLTYGLIAAIAVIFAGELAFPVSPASGFLDPSIKTLVALGALDRSLVTEGGEWWRLFSAPMLHGGPAHIALNSLALFFAGVILENAIGRVWFAAVYAVSGFCGALMSLAANSAGAISVGASGAIMGLFAAAFSVSYRYPQASPMRRYLQSGSLRVLIPSLIPLAGGLFGEKIDFAAHTGGAIGGAAIGALLVCFWPKEAVMPPYRRIAVAVAVLGVCGVLFSGIKVAAGYEPYTLSSYLIPEEQLPKGLDAVKEKSAALAAAYPRDPRSRMYRAMALGESGDTRGAEREWRAALDEDQILRLFFKPGLEQLIRANLALSMKENGEETEAKGVARPLCAGEGETRDALVKEGLCP